MDSFDLNTRLPPRKRLLAGLKESSSCDFLLPVPQISRDLYARLRDFFNSTTLSPEEVVEASRSAALSTAEVAARARAAAIEKAVAAAKARTAAKSALELLDSIARNEARRRLYLAKYKSRKKHVAVKLLYKKNRLVEPRETDQELAQRLHRAMNSSPRISSNSRKKHGCYGKAVVSDGSVVCNGNSPAFGDGDLINGSSVDKLEEVLVCSKAGLLEREEGCPHIEERPRESKGRVIVDGKKAKLKRKKLALSQCNTRDHGEGIDVRH